VNRMRLWCGAANPDSERLRTDFEANLSIIEHISGLASGGVLVHPISGG